MAALVRAKDWSKTPLGPREAWPRALHVLVETILLQPLPMLVMWGPELVQIYNDAFREFARGKHPEALGQPTAECWPEVQPVTGPLHRRVLAGESVYMRDQRLPVNRRGVIEDLFLTVSYSPVRDDAGQVAGILCVVFDTTPQVTAEAEQRRLHREVENERARLAAAFAQSPAFLAVLSGPAHEFEFVNERYMQLMGRRDLVGQTVRKAAPEVEGQGYFEILDRVYATGEPFVGRDMRILLRRQAAEPLEEAFIDFVYQPMRGEDGRVRGILVHGVDVSGRVAAERRYKTIFDATRDGLIINAADGRMIEANPAACRMHGYAYEEFMKVDVRTIVHPDDRHLFDEFVRVAGTGGEFRCEARDLRKDGTVFPVEVLGTSFTFNGKTHLLGVVRDITERRRAAERIARLYDVAAALSETLTTEQVARVTVEQGLQALGASAGSLGLLSPEGKTLEIVAHRGYAPPVIEPWLRTPMDAPIPLTDAVRRGEAIYLRTNEEREELYPAIRRVIGNQGTRSSACVPLKVGGKVVGVLGLSFSEPRAFVAEDREFVLTLARQCAQALDRARLFEAERKARAEAERANEAKSEFLAVLSHELRTPLTPVLLTLSMMESNPALPAALRDDVATIRSNVELESRLIGDLLDLTRIARGKLQLESETVDLHLAVKSAIAICQREASATLLVDLQARHTAVNGDSTRLQQVFWNLIGNAQKFTPPEGTITIRSHDVGEGWVRVEVTDTGAGIDAALLPRLFTAFEQGEIRALRPQAGLGLGLAISRRLVEAHGGTITAASAGPGKGSTFTVELPVERVYIAQQLPVASTPVAHSVRPLQVLLVEDHAATARIMVRLLGQLGHRVTASTTAAGAIAIGRERRFDLLISDLGLPDGSGLDVMRALRDRYAGRAIALTGYGMESDVAASRAAGFSEHLTKPVDLAKLEATIARVAGASGAG
jgi:PAS domain S-box-containing protein